MYTRKTVVWKTRYKQKCRKNERRLVEMGHMDMLESRERPIDSRNMAKGLRKSENPTINKVSSPLNVVKLNFTAVTLLFTKKPMLVRSQTGDFHIVQTAMGIPTDLLHMQQAQGKAKL
jgi:hypothetical protein